VEEKIDVEAVAPKLWQDWVLLDKLDSSSLFEGPVSAPPIAVTVSSLGGDECLSHLVEVVFFATLSFGVLGSWVWPHDVVWVWLRGVVYGFRK
jgi:hypothetical protein